jgi:hypothetical protein
MKEPTRWKVEELNCCFDADMVPSPDGEYVLYSDWKRLRSQFANSEWQPIETAPKDGTEVLCFCVEPEFEGEENPHTEMRVCFFGEMQEDYSCWMGYYGYEQRPTHWMPLPPKPPTK